MLPSRTSSVGRFTTRTECPRRSRLVGALSLGYISGGQNLNRIGPGRNAAVRRPDLRCVIAIRIQCPAPECRATCSAPDAASGRPVKCPKCSKPYVAHPTLDGASADTHKSRPTGTGDPFPELPAEFGRYRVLQLLGRGGMGAVYLAQDAQLGRRVALKLPFIDGAKTRRVERFAREARAAAALHHPNICTVFDAGQIGGRPFLTMAFVPGTPLDRMIDPDAPMTQDRAAGIVQKVARALGYAHAHGIVHRDLKPANIMMTAEGEPVVMDFGLAKQAGGDAPGGSRLTSEGGILGTPSYMSPEQANGDDAAIGPPTDVYALGVVLFELLTGAPPFVGGLGAVLSQIMAAPVPSARELRPDADPRLDAICQRAMAKRPADRFRDMAEFAGALRAYLSADAEPGCDVELIQKAEAAPARADDTESFGGLAATADETGEARARRRGRASTAAEAGARKGSAKRLWVAGAGLALLAPLLVWLALVVLRVGTPNGTLVVEIDDPAVEARIRNGKLVLTGPDGKDRYTLAPGERDKKVDAGPYKLRVEGADGLVLDTPEFTLKKGDKVTVRVTVDPKVVVAKKEPTTGRPVQPAATPNSKDPDWISLTASGLDEWQQDGDYWREVKSTSLDPKDEQRFIAQPGTGVLYCAASGAGAKNLVSRRPFGDYEVRADFMVPKKGNSGLFFHGHYELQVWDSWGVATPKPHDCGGLFPCRLSGSPYNGFQLAPKENASRPPGEWQTFEATFRAPRYGPDGGLVTQAKFTRAAHNGRIIHQDIEVPSPSPPKPGPGPLLLQGGFGAIAWRNIWIRSLAPGDAALPTAPTFKNELGMEFAFVPKGKSWLGGSGGKVLGEEVEIKQDFYLGKYPVTQAEWQAVTGQNPSHFSRTGPGKDAVKDATDAALGRLPVEMVSWDECQEFVKQLNKKTKQAGWAYRLPTCAEWEYACRGGPHADRTEAAFDYFFATPTNQLLASDANFGKGNAGRTNAVDAYPANRLGLHDMHGNVHQWCGDASPRGAAYRVIRGGSFWSPPDVCRALVGTSLEAKTRQFNMGLRLARAPAP